MTGGGVRRGVRAPAAVPVLVDAQGEEQVTYFEALTALAYLWFADRPWRWACSRSGWAGPGTRPTWWRRRRRDRRDGAGPSGARLDDRRGRGREGGIVKEGKVAVVREQDRRGAGGDRGPRREVGAAAARAPRFRGWRIGCRPWVVSRCRSGGCARPTTICSSRCSASTPRATRPPRSRRSRRCWDRRSTSRPREALAEVAGPGGWSGRPPPPSCSTAPTTPPAPRR